MTPAERNPILKAVLDTFQVKRSPTTGFVPRSWLLVLLRIIDFIKEADGAVSEDDIYTYDYTLKDSRGGAIPLLLNKYEMPLNLGMGHEGITTRGAPGLRFFRAIQGGAVLHEFTVGQRSDFIEQSIELIRSELLNVLGKEPVSLPSHVFEQSGTFVDALLDATQNRSNGRVEQSLVGAKLQLRYPSVKVPLIPTFAGDQQTGRDSDYELENIRVIVTVAPKESAFRAAKRLADEGKQVFLIVTDRSYQSARATIRKDGYSGKVIVTTVSDYVAANMAEIASDQHSTPRQMCLTLVAEYNRRVAADRDASLQVTAPKTLG